MKFKRITHLVMVVCLLLSCFSGCQLLGDITGSTNPTELEEIPNYSNVVPVYTDDKQLELMIFWMPPIEEQQYIWMKEYGVTAVLVDGQYHSADPVNRKKILDMCEELGMDVYFCMDRERDGSEILDYAQYLEYSCFAGFYCDEPILKYQIDNVAGQAKNVQKLSPRLRMICNMLGNYADDPNGYRWLFETEGAFLAAVASGQIFDNYAAYVQYMQDAVLSVYDNTVVSATNYPLADPEKDYGYTLVDTWLETLGKSQLAAQTVGHDMWQFIATTAYHSGGGGFYHRQPTEADIRWMSYMALAYGAKGIEEFVYKSISGGVEFDADDHGPIWWTNQEDFSTYYRTEMWYAGQAVHQELYKFDHVLLSFDWQGVICHNETNDPNVLPVFRKAVGRLSGHKRIDKIDGTGDLVIGCFQDSNEYDGFLVVNFTETANNNQETNEVSITFKYATKALVYIKGEEQLVDLTDGVFTHTLLPGEAFFIIPVA